MKNTSLTSLEVDDDLEKALRASLEGPVYISENDRASYVLLSRGEYERLLRQGPNILELLHHPESAHIDFEPSRMVIKFVDQEPNAH